MVRSTISKRPDPQGFPRKLLQREISVPTITKDVTVHHQLQKDADPTDVNLGSGDAIEIVKEWKSRYLIKNSDGQLFNVLKEYVDAS